jgi:hypothetical protein
MAFPTTQPTLPAEGAYSDSELLFISEEPKRLFPANQNSNFGLLRKALTSEPQDVINILNDLYTQMFVETATGANGYLGRWETQVGIPKAPTGATDAQRRVWINLRRQVGPFTTQRVDDIIESFLITSVGGTSTPILPGGITIDAGGITLYGEGGSKQSQYRVYYDPRTYSYQVWIVSSSAPDLTALSRKLTALTPAGMSFTIDNTKSAIVDYGKTVLNKQPSAFFRLADFTDSSGYANHGTSFGTITALTSPGLLTAGKNDDQAGKTFNGSTGYFTAPDQNYLDLGNNFTIEFWVNTASLAGTQFIVDKGANGYAVRINITTGKVQLWKSNVALISETSIGLSTATGYYVAVRKSGDTVKFTVNTTDRSGAITPATIEDTSSALYVGRTFGGINFLNGSLDELALYPYWLSDAQLLENYNAGKNINV